MSTPFTIVDLFAGPGGLDLAARQLGIPAVGIEWDGGACATRAANRLDTRHGDVRLFGPEQFEHANVLAGGPPCQTFTVAGSGSGRKALDQVLEFADRFVAREPLEAIRADLSTLEDERTGLVLEPLRWALQALDAGRPFEVIVLEQVPAVRPVWEKYAELLDKEGYSVADPKVLRTEEYGVPQTRRRAIFIARRRDSDRLSGIPGMPQPTHDPFNPLKKVRAARLHGPTGPVPMATALPDRPAPFVVISNYGTGGDPKARGRRYSHEPSATVTGKVSRNRVEAPEGVATDRFTWSEMGQLQTFPAEPDWTWTGKDISQQIGNAVPPRLGMHILAAALDIPQEDLDAAIRKHYTY
ncbi:DNA cytosine methyltransferase [Kitasatospora sp. NBC_01539]|uniref:DNA cytosine methyltransferase n=1 Tax=Kitasatospora sp. NBC_01539 TaxID=2903577 RepID=UPI0038601AE9